MNRSVVIARLRIGLAAVAIAVVAAAVTALLLMSRGLTNNTAAVGVTAALDRQAAKLNIEPRTVELTSEKARRVRDAIKNGNYAIAGKMTADILANSHLQNWRFYPFAEFMDGITDVSDPTFEAHLSAWVAQDKDDSIPLLVRARYYFGLGWFKRGGNFVQETQSADLNSFQDYMNEALADDDAAIRANGGNPYAYYLKLRILLGLGMSDQMANTFKEAVAKYPAYYPLYSVMLSAREPKWGGSVPVMYAFVDQYAGQAAQFSPLRLLYLSLYRDLLETASIACLPYKNDKNRMAQCVGSVMQRIVRPHLEDQVVTALQLYDHSDKYQFGVAIEDILSGMLSTAGGDAYSGAVLELAATSMHSDTQLKEDKPGGNNYIIDRAVSQSWYRKGFYDNSLKKELESLQDVEATVFPDEEEKDLAIAGIYEYLAGSYNQLHQYANMIAYEKAAVAVGDKTSYEHLICYGYYRLKDYNEAVTACTTAIEHEPGNLKARYWRGDAYRDMGRTTEALQDLTAVADSEDGLRTYAAIDISMIYFNRDDNKSALDVLNQYKYLYDPNTNDSDGMAVSYNNRCYAYMQLSELRKALDDCTASLKYGSIPDAYRKQQELVKRLSAHEGGL